MKMLQSCYNRSVAHNLVFFSKNVLLDFKCVSVSKGY